MKTEKKITLFRNGADFHFECGRKMTWNGVMETPMEIRIFDLDVTILFKTGRKLNFNGLPFLAEGFTGPSDPSDLPF